MSDVRDWLLFAKRTSVMVRAVLLHSTSIPTSAGSQQVDCRGERIHRLSQPPCIGSYAAYVCNYLSEVRAEILLLRRSLKAHCIMSIFD